jgi:hypothetical protein
MNDTMTGKTSERLCPQPGTNGGKQIARQILWPASEPRKAPQHCV